MICLVRPRFNTGYIKDSIFCLSIAVISILISTTAATASNRRAARFIRIPPSDCYDEKCYANLTDVYNSPLVECSFLYVRLFTNAAK
jgi:hypothetical protein